MTFLNLLFNLTSLDKTVDLAFPKEWFLVSGLALMISNGILITILVMKRHKIRKRLQYP